jgi:hypothetical protein
MDSNFAFVDDPYVLNSSAQQTGSSRVNIYENDKPDIRNSLLPITNFGLNKPDETIKMPKIPYSQLNFTCIRCGSKDTYPLINIDNSIRLCNICKYHFDPVPKGMREEKKFKKK